MSMKSILSLLFLSIIACGPQSYVTQVPVPEDQTLDTDYVDSGITYNITSNTTINTLDLKGFNHGYAFKLARDGDSKTLTYCVSEVLITPLTSNTYSILVMGIKTTSGDLDCSKVKKQFILTVDCHGKSNKCKGKLD